MHRKGDVDFLIYKKRNEKKNTNKKKRNSLTASKRGLNEFESYSVNNITKNRMAILFEKIYFSFQIEIN